MLSLLAVWALQTLCWLQLMMNSSSSSSSSSSSQAQVAAQAKQQGVLLSWLLCQAQ
jgi:hypothetical protein